VVPFAHSSIYPSAIFLAFFFFFFFFFFNDTATTEIYTVGNTLSLHDALPISPSPVSSAPFFMRRWVPSSATGRSEEHTSELQSRPTNSSAVFCSKKKTTR